MTKLDKLSGFHNSISNLEDHMRILNKNVSELSTNHVNMFETNNQMKLELNQNQNSTFSPISERVKGLEGGASALNSTEKGTKLINFNKNQSHGKQPSNNFDLTPREYNSEMNRDRSLSRENTMRNNFTGTTPNMNRSNKGKTDLNTKSNMNTQRSNPVNNNVVPSPDIGRMHFTDSIFSGSKF